MKLVVIDTNVWVSAFLNRTGFPARIKDAWVNGQFEIAISTPLLHEISEVLHRPRIKDKYGLTEDEITQFVELILRRAVLVVISGQLKLCRDERDNMFSETAIVAGAEYLISRDDDLKGDSDLIEQMRIRGVEVMTVSHFLEKLTAGA
ncbi:MAG: putative toxin-antitoxin system toxin component, PIN family [Pyrinomonadaceae bacterium]